MAIDVWQEGCTRHMTMAEGASMDSRGAALQSLPGLHLADVNNAAAVDPAGTRHGLSGQRWRAARQHVTRLLVELWRCCRRVKRAFRRSLIRLPHLASTACNTRDPCTPLAMILSVHTTYPTTSRPPRKLAWTPSLPVRKDQMWLETRRTCLVGKAYIGMSSTGA